MKKKTRLALAIDEMSAGNCNRVTSVVQRLPLSEQQLEKMFEERGTPAKGRKWIRNARNSPPGRATRTSKKAGKLRFASQKMGFALETDAFNTEFVALVEWEYDPDTFEIYPQPPDRLVITYMAKSGVRVVARIRPDALRITTAGFIYTECKTEKELLKLSEEQPERFTKSPNGQWRSPPAEAAAAALGCQFELRSTAQNNYELFENLELLKDFLSTARRDVPLHAREEVTRKLAGQPFVSAFELIHVEPRIDADHLYSMLVNKEIFFPLHALRLADQEQALFFRSEIDWKAHELFLKSDRPERRRPRLRGDLQQGDSFTWDGVPYEVINPGVDKLSARSSGPGGQLISLTYEQLDKLLDDPDFDLHRVQESPDRSEADAILLRTSKKYLEEASWRFGILFGTSNENNPLKDRQERIRFEWKRKFRQAEERWGNGFVGLIRERSGNREPKVSPRSKNLAVLAIKKYWESPRRRTRIDAYSRYERAAKRLALDAMSYQSFCTEIKKRSGHAQTVARIGEKAAYDLEPQYLELERTTPRHGTHSWHIGHIDHTPLPLKFLLGDHFSLADTVWLTILTDAFDRKIRAYYLSFDEPSYRSCMMVIRDCVRRHGRFFQRLVSDGGSEFQSAYYETLLAMLGATKHERLKGKPRYGSVCERTFHTSQTQFVTNLLGATDIVEKHFRAISPEVSPETHAVWLLDKFDAAFDGYLERVYHRNHHSGLEMSPNAAEALSLRSHGHRAFKRFIYDDQFIAQTCPEVHKGDALVQPDGIKVKYRWFSGPALRQPGVIGTRVPGRYDPWNGGICYVAINGTWHQIHSQHYAFFSKLSERSIRFATDSMRLVASKRGQKAIINAHVLARYLMTVEGQEVVARQNRNDAEAAAHRAKVQKPASSSAVPVPIQRPAAPVIDMPIRSAAENRQRKIVGDL